MCWSVQASVAMVGVGAVATALTCRRGDSPAIWLTLGYFTVMEVLQVVGYGAVDECGTLANQSVTILSYLHIVFQPFFINAFAMELVPVSVKQRCRNWVYVGCAFSSMIMLAQIVPAAAFGSCLPGSPLCAERWCTISGNWHIAWDIPYNGLMVWADQLLGLHIGFPGYMIAAFLLPLVYGAWRFVILHAIAGPILAYNLTTNLNEMPAIWCLFSVTILLIGLSPHCRKVVTAQHWWGRPVRSLN